MKFSDLNEDGCIVPGVNTTVDVQPGETERQAAKFFGHGKPKELDKKARKNSDPNKLYNMGLTESEQLDVPTPTAKQVAKKHGVPLKDISRQLAMGIKIEHEHTSSDELAREIALDHLNELPDYYDRLKKVEVKDTNETKLPPHLAKMFDKNGNKKKGRWAKDKDGKRVWVADKEQPKTLFTVTDVTPPGYGPDESVTEAKKKKDPCWKDYKQIGTKMKNGREVPNCVPENVNEAINEHVSRQVPLSDCIFRPGSAAFQQFYRTAKQMYAEGKLELNWEDQELLETDIGEYVKINGELVPLDVPFVEAEGKSSQHDDSLKGFDPKTAYAIKKLQAKYPHATDLLSALLADVEKNELDSDTADITHEKRLLDIEKKISDLVSKNNLKEAEYQGKKVELNKPKRGGSKKFYVYVKNPKTGKVKKVSWGDTTGLKTKTGNKGAVASFVARHKCKEKNDKTKAGYWACRTPRYKSLGVKGGQWW